MRQGVEMITDEQIQEYIDEHWPLVKDHPDSCDCVLCWEYIVMTEK